MRSVRVVRHVPVVHADKELVGIVGIRDAAVIATDLLDALVLEETRHAMEETRLPTGARRIVEDMRGPTRMDRLPPTRRRGP